MTDEELLNEFMDYAESVGRGAMDDSKMRAAEELDDLVRDDPERAWPLIQEAVRRSKTDRILGYVAAGPLENLLWLHSRQFIDRMELAARSDDRRFEGIIGPGPRL